MVIRFHFDDDVFWDSIYDAISQFFQNQDNVEGILGNDKFRTIGALTDNVVSVLSTAFPSDVEVI